MILADTSIWVDHVARGDARLRRALEAGEVWTHEFVIGELACGNLRDRAAVLHLLRMLPQVPVVDDGETHTFLETPPRGAGHRLDRRTPARVRRAGWRSDPHP